MESNAMESAELTEDLLAEDTTGRVPVGSNLPIG